MNSLLNKTLSHINTITVAFHQFWSNITQNATPIEKASFTVDLAIGLIALFLTLVQMRKEWKIYRSERKARDDKDRHDVTMFNNMCDLHNQLVILCENIIVDNYRFEKMFIDHCPPVTEVIDLYLDKLNTDADGSIETNPDLKYLFKSHEFIKTYIAWFENLEVLSNILIKYEDYLPDSSKYFAHILEKMSWDTNLEAAKRHCSYWLEECEERNYDNTKVSTVKGSVACLKSILQSNFFDKYDTYKFAIDNLEKKLSAVYAFEHVELMDEFSEIQAHYITQEEYDKMYNEEYHSYGSFCAVENNLDIRHEYFLLSEKRLQRIERDFSDKIKPDTT